MNVCDALQSSDIPYGVCPYVAFNVPVICSRSNATLTWIKWLVKMKESAPPAILSLIYSRGVSNGKILPVDRKDTAKGPYMQRYLSWEHKKNALSTSSIKADMYYIIRLSAENKPDNAAYRTAYTERQPTGRDHIQEQWSTLTWAHRWAWLVIVILINREEINNILPTEKAWPVVDFWPLLAVGWLETKHFPLHHLWATGTISPLSIVLYYFSNTKAKLWIWQWKVLQFHYTAEVCCMNTFQEMFLCCASLLFVHSALLACSRAPIIV